MISRPHSENWRRTEKGPEPRLCAQGRVAPGSTTSVAWDTREPAEQPPRGQPWSWRGGRRQEEGSAAQPCARGLTTLRRWLRRRLARGGERRVCPLKSLWFGDESDKEQSKACTLTASGHLGTLSCKRWEGKNKLSKAGETPSRVFGASPQTDSDCYCTRQEE